MVGVLVVVSIAVTASAIVMAIRGRGWTRVLGVLLALLPGHVWYYDSQLRGCFNEECDRANYLIPLLLAHLALVLVAATASMRGRSRRR
jgi:hypothetical protein